MAYNMDKTVKKPNNIDKRLLNRAINKMCKDYKEALKRLSKE